MSIWITMRRLRAAARIVPTLCHCVPNTLALLSAHAIRFVPRADISNVNTIKREDLVFDAHTHILCSRALLYFEANMLFICGKYCDIMSLVNHRAFALWMVRWWNCLGTAFCKVSNFLKSFYLVIYYYLLCHMWSMFLYKQVVNLSIHWHRNIAYCVLVECMCKIVKL
jgi:hypothetical protein